MTIGERIKERRKELDISVDKLADILGKNRATIYRYESDDIENLPISILEPLAEALHTTPAYLMGWYNYEENNNDELLVAESVDNITNENDMLLKSITKQLNQSNMERLFNYAKKLLDLQNDDESINFK